MKTIDFAGIMIFQCGFISYNTCTTLTNDVDSGGNYACWGAKVYIGNLSIFQFCCKHKTALKKKSLMKSTHMFTHSFFTWKHQDIFNVSFFTGLRSAQSFWKYINYLMP